jgi:hypothetical protein
MSKKKLAEAQSKIENLMHANVQLAQQAEAVRQAYLLITKHNDGLLLHISSMEECQMKKKSKLRLLWERMFK